MNATFAGGFGVSSFSGASESRVFDFGMCCWAETLASAQSSEPTEKIKNKWGGDHFLSREDLAPQPSRHFLLVLTGPCRLCHSWRLQTSEQFWHFNNSDATLDPSNQNTLNPELKQKRLRTLALGGPLRWPNSNSQGTRCLVTRWATEISDDTEMSSVLCVAWVNEGDWSS